MRSRSSQACFRRTRRKQPSTFPECRRLHLFASCGERSGASQSFRCFVFPLCFALPCNLAASRLAPRRPWATACQSPLGASCGSGNRGAKATPCLSRGGAGASRFLKPSHIPKRACEFWCLHLLVQSSRFVAGTLAYEDGGGSVSVLGDFPEVEEQVKLLRQKVLDEYGSTGVLKATDPWTGRKWKEWARELELNFGGAVASSLPAKAHILLPRGRLRHIGESAKVGAMLVQHRAIRVRTGLALHQRVDTRGTRSRARRSPSLRRC